MAKGLKIRGEKEIIKNLNLEILKIDGDVRSGLQAAGLFIQAESQKLTPVDSSVLRNSAFSSTIKTADGSSMNVGYTAEYAPWVHEMPMTLKGQPRKDFGTTRKGVSFGGGSGKGVYWQDGENKFLEKAVVRNSGKIINIIKKRVKR